jgi:Fur family ferric uptake transcriptional regulator
MVYATKQRAVILEVIRSAGHPLTPAEILESAKTQEAGVGIATVYRALRVFMEQGQVVPVEISGESRRYESAEQPHHHHFLCRQCHQIYNLQGCFPGLDRLAPAAFRVEGHEIVLYGVCDACVDTKTK